MPRNPQVHFRLKPEDNDGKQLIYLEFLYNKNRLFYSFGQRITPSNWDKPKQRVKSNKQTIADGDYSLNDLLDTLKKVCEKTYKEELATGIPSPEKMKEHLEKVRYQNLAKKPEGPTLYNLIERFTAGEIKYKGRDKSPNTIKTYNTFKKHLEEFDIKNKTISNFDNINLDFYYKYVSFLKSKNLSQNAMAKDIQILKVFMGEAIDLKYTNNMEFRQKKFAIERQETDAIFLTEKEILKLYRHDFSGNKKLEGVRDLFVFGCFVGLRYSDYSNIKPGNVVQIEGDYFIKLKTQKTKEQVIIPCNPVVIEIFDKYQDNANKLPRSLSNQKFNDYIKDACEAAELTEQGRLITDPNLKLWECVSSHTARRSFATNYYLQGFPTIDLMKITGHRTEKAFMRYIRVTKLDAAKNLNAHMKKMWSQKILKIA